MIIRNLSRSFVWTWCGLELIQEEDEPRNFPEIGLLFDCVRENLVVENLMLRFVIQDVKWAWVTGASLQVLRVCIEEWALQDRGTCKSQEISNDAASSSVLHLVWAWYEEADWWTLSTRWFVKQWSIQMEEFLWEWGVEPVDFSRYIKAEYSGVLLGLKIENVDPQYQNRNHFSNHSKAGVIDPMLTWQQIFNLA